MKSFFSILSLVSFSLGQLTYAQTLIFQEEFDGPTFPAGWLLRNVDAKTPNSSFSTYVNAWQIGEYGSDTLAVSNSWYEPVGQADDWMWTPLISGVKSNSELKWKSWSIESTGNYLETFEVRIMPKYAGPPTGGTGVIGNQLTSSQLLTTINDESNVGLTPHSVSLAAYAGQSVFIGFRNISNDKFLLGVDDVEIYSTPGRIYVDANVGESGNTGQSWFDAYSDLQSALENAIEGDTILVAQGTYMPSVAIDIDSSGTAEDREKTFYINKNIKIFGGFQNGETDISKRDGKLYPTILSGNIGNAADSTDNAYHVVYIDGIHGTEITAACVFDGFIVEDGQSDLASGNYLNASGGGLYIGGESISGREVKPQIMNCKFRNNYAYSGGGLYADGYKGSVGPTIKKCEFTNNLANLFGGGMYITSRAGVATASIDSCYFNYNVAGKTLNYGGGGGAIRINCGSVQNKKSSSNISIKHCEFKGNQSLNANIVCLGGAINHTNSGGESYLFIQKCIFEKNVAYQGGALANNLTNYNADTTGNSNVIIDQCIFKENQAIQSGGAIQNDSFGEALEQIIVSTLFYKNQVTGVSGADNGRGGAMYNYAMGSSTYGDASCTVSAINTTFNQNMANASVNTGGAVRNWEDEMATTSMTVTNSIIWDNQDGLINNDSSTATFENSIVQNGLGSGSNNLGNVSTADPKFVDAANGVHQLRCESPARDAGKLTAAPSDSRDLFDISVSGPPDIGAFEFSYAVAFFPIANGGNPLLTNVPFILANSVIENTNNANFIAGYSIGGQSGGFVLLQPGFEVAPKSGEASVFTAAIGGGCISE